MSHRKSAAQLAETLAAALGHGFARPELLRAALTHPSAAPRAARRSGRDAELAYERLEFLGDRVLGLILAHELYRTYPDENEGALAKRLAALARKEALAEVAGLAGLGEHLILSRGEAEAGGRANPALLSDACEAVIGALYLDSGLDAAASFIRRYWRPLMAAEARPPQDAKTALQEWAQAAGLALPAYRTIRAEGPAHEPMFLVEVQVAGQPAVSASGRTKRLAEQRAAQLLLDRLHPGS
ncbi:MAG: ribonuclease III [Dongiaceae bacterium]